MAMMLVAFCANAFDFDGIDLNSNYTNVAQEISKRGYIYDSSRDCLKGNCQGKEIYLSLDYTNVSKSGKVGKLTVEIPTDNPEVSFNEAVNIFNVVYHQIPNNGSFDYAVSNDGTKLVVSKNSTSIVLTYITPFYKQK